MACFLHRVTNTPGQISKLEEPAMQKKSLIRTLKTTKKANVAAAPAKNEGKVTKKTQWKAANFLRMEQ